MQANTSRRELRLRVRSNLKGINASIKNINKICDVHGEQTRRGSVQNIIDQCEHLSLSNSTEMLGGLSQILTFLSNRMSELDVLYEALGDPSCVSPEILRDILNRPEVMNQRYILRELVPLLPEDLRDTLLAEK